MFSKDINTCNVWREAYTDQWWYKKWWFQDTWLVYMWMLKPLTVKDWIDMSRVGKEYSFHTDLWSDIRQSDKLYFWSDVYNVKWVSKHTWIVINRLFVVVEKW